MQWAPPWMVRAISNQHLVMADLTVSVVMVVMMVMTVSMVVAIIMISAAIDITIG